MILICIKYHLLKNNTKDCGQLELIVTNTAVAGTACRHIAKTTNTLGGSSDGSNIFDEGFKVEGGLSNDDLTDTCRASTIKIAENENRAKWVICLCLHTGRQKWDYCKM